MEASDFIVGNYFGAGDAQFTIDDILDLPKEDDLLITDTFFHNNSAAVDSCNSSVSGSEHQLSASELCFPYDNLGELEWLSNFVGDSLSSNDMQNSQFIPVANTPQDERSPIFNNLRVGKARSKRSRAAPCNWSSRLLHLSTTPDKASSVNTKTTSFKRREKSVETTTVRRCLHCASEKTPQWRTGPLGPKTLCNACGVRYKSGRLVPEYRPAASPTFVSARHSNSHRKVMELRRQQEQQQKLIGGQSDGDGDDYLIHHPSVPNFRHML